MCYKEREKYNKNDPTITPAPILYTHLLKYWMELNINSGIQHYNQIYSTAKNII
jgi:hypothetical protein